MRAWCGLRTEKYLPPRPNIISKHQNICLPGLWLCCTAVADALPLTEPLAVAGRCTHAAASARAERCCTARARKRCWTKTTAACLSAAVGGARDLWSRCLVGVRVRVKVRDEG